MARIRVVFFEFTNLIKLKCSLFVIQKNQKKNMKIFSQLKKRYSKILKFLIELLMFVPET